MASSISDRRRLVARLVVLLALLMLGALQSPVRAAPDDTIPGWQWHMIANRDGVPPLVRSITQTPDGYIWLGSYYGIHRFDGARFQLLPPSSETPQQSSVIATLLATPDGNLWAGHDWGGLSVVRGDTHRMVSKPYLATVPLLRANAGGTTWAVASNGKQVNLARLIGGRWVIWAHTAMGYMTDAAVGRDGSLWFTVDDRLLVASPIDHGVRQVRPRIASPFTLTTDGAGQVWLVTRDSLRRLSPPSPTGEAVGPPIAKPASPKVGTVIFDGTSDIWAIEDDALLRRYHLEPGGHGLRMTGSWHSPYQISNPSYPLSQTPMLVDREHNLWIATSRGLLRFSHAAFTLALDAAASSVTWILPYGAVTDRRGTVWLWRKGDLFSVAPDGSLIAHPEAASTVSFSPCVAAQGGVWMARDEHTLVLIGGPTRRTIRLSGQGSLQRPLSRVMPGDCAEDSRGRLWADQVGGLHLLAPGPQRPVPLGEDSGFQVLNMVAMEDGTMAAYIGHGSLWRTDGTHSVKLWDEKAITLGSIEVMVHRKGGLLLGGDRGIARYDGHGFATLTSRRFPFLATTTGIAQTAQGDTWLQSSKGVIQLKTADLDRAFDDPAFVLHPRIFTMDDGLPGAAAFFNLSNVNADRFGHVWVTTDNGIARHDPGQRWNPAVPPVLITGLTDGNDRYAPRAKVALPPGAGRIRIDFTALSFADPARMQFRYRMLGVDPDWVDPRGERSASYTGLAPGTYRFQVIAANNEGVWNRQGATIELMLAPRVWQTWWFRAACATLGLGLIWALYRWRMHALARRLREQAAQRAHERERVARDIHDTLLQGIQGLVLRFQSIAARMMPGDPHRALIETTLDRADEVIAQGKERVLGLRDDDQPVALPEMIRHQLGEAPFPLDVDKAFTVLGSVVPVQTWVAVEIREIVGEALFNAARHARATRITLDLVYGGRMLEVVVEDNGIGIDREAPGATTGFGMTGMRGRALGIGGTIAIAGAPTGGTRVHLRVPARRAYVLASLWRLLRRR